MVCIVLPIASGFLRRMIHHLREIRHCLFAPTLLIEEAMLHLVTKKHSLGNFNTHIICKLPSFVLHILPATRYLNDHHTPMVFHRPTDMRDM